MPIPKSVLSKYKNEVFVETGTLSGEGIVAALACGFKEIHSIDINQGYINAEMHRCTENNGVHLYCGSSDTLLPTILNKIVGRITFWLDAHPDGLLTLKNTPVLGELQAIDYHMSISEPSEYPTVMLDDMRLFSHEDKQQIESLLKRWPGTVVFEDTLVAPKDVMVYVPDVR